MKPKVLTLDPNDENIILEIPEDRDPEQPEDEVDKTKKSKVTWKLRHVAQKV